MEQDKKKIVSDLYAIRATMSLVAENDDSADPERDEVDDCNYTISNLEDDIEKKKKSTRSELSAFSIDKRINELNDGLEEINNHYKKAEAQYDDYYWRLKENFISAFFANWWHKYVSLIVEHPFVAIWFLPLYIGGIFISIPFILVFTIAERRKDKKEIIRWQREKDQYSNQMARISAEIKSLTKKRDAGEVWIACRAVTAAQQSIRDFEEKTNQQIAVVKQKIPIHQSAIKAIAEKSQAIIDDATKAYPLIDLRDWENVDLLIYYFETGRADNMKEALQLVDRQRQTEMLAEAIAMASEEICKTIHFSMNQLGDALAQSFSLLSSQMAQQHEELLSEMEEQAVAQKEASAEQLKAIHAQTAVQVVSQAMNHALLAKISDSSLDLAEQMHRQIEEVHELYV